MLKFKLNKFKFISFDFLSKELRKYPDDLFKDQ